MSKFIRTAAMVIGAVALIATGIGAVGGLAMGASLSTLGATTVGLAGIGSLSVSTLATIASVAGLVASLAAKRPNLPDGGSQTQFKADPDAAVPYVMGETQVGGNIVYWNSHGGNNNPFESLVTVHSGCGPIEGYTQTIMDGEPLNFSGGLEGVHQIDGHDRIWQDYRLGATVSETALMSTWTPWDGTPPEWTADKVLPGLAATLITFVYDGKGNHTLTSTPKMQMRGRYVKIYDPRLDSTYPGGSGTCRALDETTYIWSRNGVLHGLTWALGRWKSGKRVGGIGAPIDSIDVASFVDGANNADANGWTCDGQVDLARGKWNSLKLMLQSAGCEPVWQGARLACLVRKPRISLGVIPKGDIVGDATLPQMQTRRDRINCVIPRYRSADHQYEMVDAGPVTVTSALAQDGDRRTRRIDYPLVQCSAGASPDQAAALAYLDAAAAREAGPIVLPLKPQWIGARFGDCWTLPDGMGDLSGKTVLVRERSLDPVRGIPTLTFLTEDMGKYPIALAQIGVAAPIEDSGTPPSYPAPAVGAWTFDSIIVTGDGSSVPVLRLTGAVDAITADSVIFEYRPAGTTDWLSAGMEPATATSKIIAGVAPGTAYEVAISYRTIGVTGPRRILGPVTTGAAGTSSGRYLLESGGRLLLESGDQLLMET